MKKKKYAHLKIYRPKSPAYPGGADRAYFANKALDIITGISAVIGFVTAFTFMVIIC